MAFLLLCKTMRRAERVIDEGYCVLERFLPLRMCKHFSHACDNA